MPDWKCMDWGRLTERFLIGIVWFPTMFSLVCDIVVGVLFLHCGLLRNENDPHPHPAYRERWTQLYYGKRSRGGILMRTGNRFSAAPLTE